MNADKLAQERDRFEMWFDSVITDQQYLPSICLAWDAWQAALAEYDAQPAQAAQPHPEDSCERCGGKNIKPWFAPSPIWNRVADNDWSIICPQCFVELAREVGIDPTAWRLAPEDYAGPNDDPSRQAAQPVGVPDGWVMVPREPNKQMIGAYLTAQKESVMTSDRAWGCSDPEQNFKAGYSALLACTPQPPAQPSADAEDAARYRWLRPRLLTADFEYGDDSETVLVFLIPTTMAVSPNLDESIDAARAAEGDE